MALGKTLKLNSALYAGLAEIPLLKEFPDSPVTMVGQKVLTDRSMRQPSTKLTLSRMQNAKRTWFTHCIKKGDLYDKYSNESLYG